jgi:predicted HTH transcriptional regulator
MGALASADLPGHQRLRERIVYALNRCIETQDVDFKQAAAWSDLKWRIIETALAMGNLRDGGIIIVGVSQRNKKWKLNGVPKKFLETYDPDIVVDQINSYISPFVDLEIVSIRHDGKTFVAIYVREFAEVPLVCKKNGPQGTGLYEGSVYVRPPGLPRSTRITNAAQMNDLLELAAEKRARRILAVASRIGLEPGVAGPNPFDKELEGL